jgi:hypothetical protein
MRRRQLRRARAGLQRRSISGQRAMECHLFILFDSRTRITSGLARICLFPPENSCRYPFCAKTPGSQFWSDIDFASGIRKSFTCRSRHSGDLRPLLPGLKVLGLFLKSSANVLQCGLRSLHRNEVDTLGGGTIDGHPKFRHLLCATKPANVEVPNDLDPEWVSVHVYLLPFCHSATLGQKGIEAQCSIK